MTNEEALEWLEEQEARKFNREEDRFLQIETPDDGTRYLVSVSPHISANGSTLSEAVQKCKEIRKLHNKKEASRKKYVAKGLIK